MEAGFRLERLRALELRLLREYQAAKPDLSPFAARLLDCCQHRPERSHRWRPRLPQLQGRGLPATDANRLSVACEAQLRPNKSVAGGRKLVAQPPVSIRRSLVPGETDSRR